MPILGRVRESGKKNHLWGFQLRFPGLALSRPYLYTQISFFLCIAGSIILIILELVRKLKKREQGKIHNLYTEIQARDLC